MYTNRPLLWFWNLNKNTNYAHAANCRHLSIPLILQCVQSQDKKSWQFLRNNGIFSILWEYSGRSFKLSHSPPYNAERYSVYLYHKPLIRFHGKVIVIAHKNSLPTRSSLLRTTLRLYFSEGRWRSFSSTEDFAVSCALCNTRKYR
jgi:hypothetical protein